MLTSTPATPTDTDVVGAALATEPAVPAADRQPLLVAKGMSKHFGRVQALVDADLELYPGEVVALVGDNGAGKSTLIKAIAGVQPADEGRTSVQRGSLERGPSESLIVGGSNVFLAAAGIARPRVIVSAGALTALDDEELAAGLEHERGHIARRHRYVLVFAELSRGLARFLPGTRRAVQELRYHLERDADRWAVAHRHDPYALAAAICKATMPRSPRGPWVASLGGGDATRRVDELLGNGKGRPGPGLTHGLQAVAILLCCLAITLLASLPSTALAGIEQFGQPAHRHCEH